MNPPPNIDPAHQRGIPPSKRRQFGRSPDREASVIIAWLEGEISEGRARELLHLDVLALRERRDRWAEKGVALARADRAANPVKP